MKILLVEDDEALCHNIYFHLIKVGYIVDCCYNGKDALDFIDGEFYDLIILDRMLPGIDGLEVLKQIRAHAIQSFVIMATALGAVNDRVIGLDSGADDYIVKPFSIEELLARIRALKRRPNQCNTSNALTLGNTTLDTINQTLQTSQHTCSLSKKEFQLLEFFFYHPNTTLHRDAVLSNVWDTQNSVENGNLDNYIYFLRRRLNMIESTLTIKTIRGVGFCLEAASC